jgi:hypothetical protein
LKRCRDAIVRDPRRGAAPDGAGAAAEAPLADQYLQASPDAAELFSIWDASGKVSTRCPRAAGAGGCVCRAARPPAAATRRHFLGCHARAARPPAR